MNGSSLASIFLLYLFTASPAEIGEDAIILMLPEQYLNQSSIWLSPTAGAIVPPAAFVVATGTYPFRSAIQDTQHEWDASRVSSGIYLYGLTVGQDNILSYGKTKKLVVLK